MVKPIIRGDKVQAWTDKEGFQHIVLYSSEPHKLGCRPIGMWNYSPKLALIEDINCPGCRIELESGV